MTVKLPLTTLHNSKRVNEKETVTKNEGQTEHCNSGNEKRFCKLNVQLFNSVLYREPLPL